MADPGIPEPARVLLAICAAPDADHTGSFACLDEDGWHTLVSVAIEQRAAPLLQRAVRRAGPSAAPPPDIVAAIAAAVLGHVGAMLRQRQSLATIVRILGPEGLHPVVLKGVRLAYRDYPEPQLRPMRDLDLLLEPDAAVRAQAMLRESGYFAPAEWSSDFGIEDGHQLPTLRDTRNGTLIEVHHRLYARGWVQEPLLVAEMMETAEWLEFPEGTRVKVPSAHANLLHLIEHATLHHLFDNGPQTLADLHFVAAGGQIDWVRLQSEAARLGLARALRLIAAVAARHGAVWPQAVSSSSDPAVDPAHLDLADVVLLRSGEERQRLGFMRRLELRTDAGSGWRAALKAMLDPSAQSLAEIVGCKPQQRRRWLAYPVWLVRRGARFFDARRRKGLVLEASHQADLAEWLGVEWNG